MLRDRITPLSRDQGVPEAGWGCSVPGDVEKAYALWNGRPRQEVAESGGIALVHSAAWRKRCEVGAVAWSRKMRSIRISGPSGWKARERSVSGRGSWFDPVQSFRDMGHKIGTEIEPWKPIGIPRAFGSIIARCGERIKSPENLKGRV